MKQLYAVVKDGQPRVVAYGQRATLRLFRLRLVQFQTIQMTSMQQPGLLDEHGLRVALGYSFVALVQRAQCLFHFVLVVFVRLYK